MVVKQNKNKLEYDNIITGTGSSNSSISSINLNVKDRDEKLQSNFGNIVWLSSNSLLDNNELPSEEMLENLLRHSSSPYIFESNNKSIVDDENDNDGMSVEVSRLAAAEENVRRELEMVMCTQFEDEKESENEPINPSVCDSFILSTIRSILGKDDDDSGIVLFNPMVRKCLCCDPT